MGSREMTATIHDKRDRALRAPLVCSASVLLYAIVLRLLAESPLVSQYAYIGFGGEYESPTLFIGVLIAILIMTALTPTRLSRPSIVVIWALLLVNVVPTVVILPTMPELATSTKIAAGVAVTVGYLILIVIYRSFEFGASSWRGLDYRTFRLLLILFGTSLAIFVVITFGLGSGLSSWSDMYSARAEFSFSIGSGSAVALYSLNWLVKIVSPLMLAMGIARWDVLLLAYGLGIQVLAYSISPNKLHMFIVLLVITVSFTIKRLGDRRLSLATTAASLAGLVAAVAVVFASPGNALFATTVFRTLFIPLQTALLYAEFFANNPPGMFADAVPVTSSPYQLPLSEVIAQSYSSSTTASFNAHLWADGSANLGLMGVGIVSIVLAVTLLCIDRFARGKPPLIPIAALIGPALSVTNGSLTAALLTSGLGLAAVVAFLAPSQVPLRTEQSGMDPSNSKHLEPVA